MSDNWDRSCESAGQTKKKKRRHNYERQQGEKKEKGGYEL